MMCLDEFFLIILIFLSTHRLCAPRDDPLLFYSFWYFFQSQFFAFGISLLFEIFVTTFEPRPCMVINGPSEVGFPLFLGKLSRAHLLRQIFSDRRTWSARKAKIVPCPLRFFWPLILEWLNKAKDAKGQQKGTRSSYNIHRKAYFNGKSQPSFFWFTFVIIYTIINKPSPEKKLWNGHTRTIRLSSHRFGGFACSFPGDWRTRRSEPRGRGLKHHFYCPSYLGLTNIVSTGWKKHQPVTSYDVYVTMKYIGIWQKQSLWCDENSMNVSHRPSAKSLSSSVLVAGQHWTNRNQGFPEDVINTNSQSEAAGDFCGYSEPLAQKRHRKDWTKKAPDFTQQCGEKWQWWQCCRFASTCRSFSVCQCVVLG